MAKKNFEMIQNNPYSTFVGVFITLKGRKLTKVQFSLKGSDLKPGMGGMVVGEFKNYKKTIQDLELANKRLKNEKDDLVEGLVTIANAEYLTADEEVFVPEPQEELRNLLDAHAIDWDLEEDFEDEEEFDEGIFDEDE